MATTSFRALFAACALLAPAVEGGWGRATAGGADPLGRAAKVAAVAPIADDADDAGVPDEKATRGEVDALIQGFKEAHKPATVGLIEAAIDRSISFGAPAYNAGDRAACYRFYAKTAESLVAAFPDDASATEPARRALADLRTALDRAKRARGADGGAWAMRLAFDKTNLAAGLTAESGKALVRMGDEYFRRSQFEEAQDAFESATAALAELDGQPREQVPPAVRYAPLGLGNALFAQKKFRDASAAILTGLGSLPEWPEAKFDLRGLHADPAEYEAVLDRLRAAVDRSPDDAALHFLLGYEYWFTGKRDTAREQFDGVLKIDPKHAGARLFIDAAEARRRKDAKKV